MTEMFCARLQYIFINLYIQMIWFDFIQQNKYMYNR